MVRILGLQIKNVSDGLYEIISLASNTKSSITCIFSDYVLDSDIDSDNDFSPTLWTCEPIYNSKTTNGAEKFHKRYNSQSYTAHPCIQQVTVIIIEIQSETDSILIISMKTNK